MSFKGDKKDLVSLAGYNHFYLYWPFYNFLLEPRNLKENKITIIHIQHSFSHVKMFPRYFS
jgi:hypothetical protein